MRATKLHFALKQALMLPVICCLFAPFAQSTEPGDISIAPVCENLFSPDSTFRESLLDAWNENLPGVLSKFGPVYSDSRFDVRIASVGVRHNIDSPTKLRSEVIDRVGELLTSLSRLGFPSRSYLQILVEAHPDAVLFRQSGELTWRGSRASGNGPKVISDGKTKLSLPIGFGLRHPFPFRQEAGEFPVGPRVLFFPAERTGNEFSNKFTVAHELAHTSEGGLASETWREARADFLAYLTTGETQMVYSGERKIVIYDIAGGKAPKLTRFGRDFARPDVKTISELRPNLSAYHVNSTLYSNALLEISRLIGRSRIVAFLRWMDEVGQAHLPFLMPQFKEDTFDEIPLEFPSVQLVDQSDVELVRGAVQREAKEFGQLVRFWFAAQNFAPEVQARLEDLLAQREI